MKPIGDIPLLKKNHLTFPIFSGQHLMRMGHKKKNEIVT